MGMITLHGVGSHAFFKVFLSLGILLINTVEYVSVFLHLSFYLDG
jgi:hypothetical protein